MLAMKYIFKDLLANRTRLFLTILAVAWGTFSIATMLAIGEGLRLTFSNVTQSTNTETLIARPGQSTLDFRGQAPGVTLVLQQQDLEALRKALAEEALISGEINWNQPIYHGKKTWQGPPIFAVDEYYSRVHPMSLEKDSRVIDQQDVKQHRAVILLGNRVVQELFGPAENPLGKTVFLANKPFLVIGIQRKSLQLFNGSRMTDDFASWIPSTTYQELTNKQDYNSFLIAPKQLTDVARIQNEMLNFIANNRQLNPNDAGILNFTNLQEQKQKISIFLYGMEAALGLIGGLTLLVAGVGIANVMMISVTRATREIGIKMALGATTYEILFYYACEALLTTFIGGGIGFLLTYLLLFLINQIPFDSKIFSALGSPKPILSWNVMLIVTLTLGIVGLCAGLFPARKAASIHPAEALRHEK